MNKITTGTAKGWTWRYKRGYQNHKMWGKRVRKCRCFSPPLEYLYAYQSKKSRWRKGLIYLKKLPLTTNQKHTIGS